ncbi:Transmembrane protein 43 [Amphibalanus amphitrite]|uniref:Transmembrane protein 43 n=2 Tax=Amphibalanus amphitrite TaxID=1232801 RepID=A0A6A4VXJ5_AMPAM|nr:Transmembrane protein 43 [Amphibalanus amphitrite]KAF0294588.1 Transmembrane protein 43 [Amphibalanus amphitrite]
MDEDGLRQRQTGAAGDDTEPLLHSRTQARQPPSFWESIKASMVLSLVGIAIFFGGIGLQFWNEGRAVERAKALSEGLSSAVPLSAPQRPLPENDGRLVHFTAQLEVPQPLTEPRYGVAVAAVKLKRRVQMYQWVEEQSSRTVETADGQQVETSYNYYKTWKDKLVDSSSFNSPFNHENPKTMPLESRIQEAPVAHLAGFLVTEELRQLLTRFTVFASDERPADRSIKLHGDIFYHCDNIESPAVGDIRVQFAYAGKSGDTVSVVGKQEGDRLVPYRTSNGHQLLLLQPGRRTHHDIFADELSSNRALTWWLRGAGWLLTFVGLSCLTSLLNVLVSRFPVVREVVALGVTSLNFSVSVAVSLATVAVSWLWFRPLVGVCLLVAAALPVLWRWRWADADQWEPRPPRVTVTRPRGLFRSQRAPPAAAAAGAGAAAAQPPPYGWSVPS